MKLRPYLILLLCLSFLFSCSTLSDIDSCSYDFLLKSQSENSNNISIGKPIKLGVNVSELDKSNPELLQTFITYSCDESNTANSSSSPSASIEINNTEVYPGEPISHNYLKNNILWFSFTPKQNGIYKIIVNVSNSEVKKTVELTIDCSNPFFTVLTDNIPEYALIDKKYDFNLIIEEYEPSKIIQTTAKIVKGSGTLYLSESKINDDSIAHPLTTGKNTLQYISKESGDNIIEFLIENEWGYNRKIQVPLRISLPKWLLKNSGADTIAAPYKDNFTTKFDVIEEDIFEINEFSGLYRLLSNSDISLIINSKPIEQGKSFPVNKGTNVIVLNSNTKGMNQIELIVKDKYHQEKKDTLNFNVNVSTKPIEASVDKLSQTVKVNQPAKFSLTLSEKNYSDVFFIKLDSVNGKGFFSESSLRLSAGTHVISYTPSEIGTHTFKVLISDKNNQTEELTITVQAELSKLTANIDKPHLILSQNKTGYLALTVNENDYTGKYSLTYTTTNGNGSLSFNSLSLKENQISYFKVNENVISYTPTTTGDATINFIISDEYGQSVELSVLVSCKIAIEAMTTGGGTVTGGGFFDKNTEVILSAIANSGYAFDGWYEGNIQVSNSLDYKFQATESRILEAKFSPITHTITATAQTGGTVTGSGVHNHGSTVTLTATANSGYAFDGWYEGNIQVSTSPSYTFKAEKARSLEARFTANKHTIVANAQTGGTVTGGGTLSYGTNATVVATVKTGYTFVGWYEGSTQVSTSPSYSFKVEKDRTLEARFTINKFNIIANAQTGGSATGSGTFNYGDNATLVATAQIGYTFVGWYEGSTQVSNILSYTFKVEQDRVLEARFSTKAYTIALTATTGGSVAGGGSFEHNKSVSVVATANSGYKFLGWYDNDAQVSTSLIYTFKAEKDRNLQAKFEEIKYTITATAQVGGSATGSGEYKYNTDVTLKATANSGYAFDGWYEGSTKVSSSLTYTFKADKARTLEAKFLANSYTVTATAGTGGTVTGGGAYGHGSTVTLVASISTGYVFDGWYEGSSKVSSSASYAFTVSGARTLEARFTANKHTIVANAQTGGTVTGGGTLSYGTNATVVATVKTGYTFVGWYEGSTQVSTSPSYSFKVEKDRTLEARFTINKFNIIANAQTGGSATGSGTFNYGDNATLVAIAQIGYTFVGWYEGSTQVSNVLSYTFKVEQDRVLEARFSTKAYTIALTATTGGSVAGGGSFEHNKSVSVVATANSGYKFLGWYDNDAQVSTSLIYTFKAEKDRNLQAKFEEIKYTITATAQVGGSATGSGEYKYNTDVTLKATANSGYAFDGWYEGSTKVSSSLTYTFKADKARTLEAKFLANSYTVTATAGTGGTVTGGGAYGHGSTVTLVASISTGYVFDGWYEGSSKVSSSASYAFTVSGARTLEARFTANKHTIVANAQTGGTVTGGGTLSYGTNATVVATVKTGYTFVGWYEGSTQVSTSPSYSFKVEKDRTLEARFTINKFNIIANAQTGGSATGSGTFNYGDNATLVAIAQIGYTFVGWYEGSTQVSNVLSYTFKVEQDRVLEARFSTKAYTIALTATTGGSVAGGGSFEHNKSVSVVATANSGYKFLGWYDNDAQVSTSLIYTFKAEKDRNLQAKFEEIKYTITATAQVGGSATGSGEYKYNTDVTLKATANSGYAFDGWYEGSTKVSSSLTYTFKADKARTLEAKFLANSYTVTATAGTGGTVTGGGAYGHGSTVTLVASISTGYVFDGWYEGSSKVSSSASYAFTVSGARTLEARFTANKHTIVANAQTGGTVTGGGTLSYGTNATVVATVKTGYTFVGWYEGSTQVSTSPSYSFKVEKDRTLEARFTINKFNIIANAQTGGSATGSGTFNYGDNATLVAIAQIGYTFVGWYEGSTQVSNVLSYTFKVEQDRVLEARFSTKAYTIALTATTGGSVAGGGSFEHNKSVSVVATANSGYKFLGWYDNDAQVSTSLIYTFKAEKDRNLQAKFEEIKYTITATAQVGGSATGSGEYKYNTDVTLKATANSGYAFDGWYEGSTKVSSSLTYTFKADKARTLEAKFLANSYTVTATAGTGGTVTGGGAYGHGSTVTLVASISTGYVFDGWYEGSSKVSSSASYAFTVSGARTLEARFTANKHTIVANAQTGGTVTGGGTLSYGTNATVVATVKTGYTFVGWYEGSTQVSTSPSYSFKVEKDRTLEARFTINKFNIIANAQTGGSATGSGTFNYGDNATLVATAQIGYTFVGWYEGSTQVSNILSYTFKVEQDRVLEARFSTKAYTIALTATTGGSVAGGGSFEHNKSVSVVATANSGYKFLGWYDNDAQVSTSLIYTFKAEKDRNLQAKFEEIKYTITATAQVGGSATGSGEYKYNTDVTLKATANSGYAFDGWYEGSTQASTALTYTFKASKDRTLEARFSINKYTITATAQLGGTVTGGGAYSHGSSVALVAITTTGYTFAGWYEGSTKVSTAANYTFTASGARTLEARFSVNKYSVVVNALTGGTATGAGSYAYNTNATVVATANTHYTFDGWYEGSTKVSNTDSYTFKITGTRTLEAKFISTKYTITATAQTGGTVAGAGSYSYGTNATLVATANSGYAFDGWYEGSTKVSSSASYAFTVSGARTLEARFTISKYTIVATAQTGGTVTGAGSYNYGSNVTVTASIQTGYTFDGWYEGATKVSSSLSYTFTVSGGRTLEARFTANKYNIVVNALTGGSATGAGSYAYNTNTTVTASVSTGYVFDGWYEGATKVSSSLSYTFTVTGARTLQARFTANKYNIVANALTGGTATGAGSYSYNTNATITATVNTGYVFDGWYESSTKVSSSLSYTFTVTGARTLEARFTANKYNIVVNALTGGSATGAGSYAYNTNTTVTASVSTGYVFDGWYEGSTKVSSSLSYTFTVTGARTLQARFTANKYNIVVNAQTGGTATGAGSYSHGTNAIVVATAKTGYTFVGWYEGSTQASTALTYTFTVTGARTLEARFTVNKYNIVVNAQAGGTATGSGSYSYGTNTTVVATAATGYTFDGWYEGTSKVSTTTSYTFTVSGGRTLEARFVANKYNIITNTQTGGTVTGAGSYSYNTNATVVTTVSTGYSFDGWYEGSTKVSTTTSYTFKVEKDRTLEARFVANKYNIVVNAQAGGTATGSGSYSYNTNATVVATVSTGYDFAGWYEGSTKVSSSLTYTFTVTGGRTLEARFTIRSYTITTSAQAGGSATGSGTFNYGINATVAATVNTGYDFSGWYEGTSRVSTTTSYTFKVEKDRILDARFTAQAYTITTKAQTGGSVAGGGTHNYGQKATIVATATSGYLFTGWYEGSTKVSSTTSYTFTVSGARTLEARFQLNDFTFTRTKTPVSSSFYKEKVIYTYNLSSDFGSYNVMIQSSGGSASYTINGKAGTASDVSSGTLLIEVTPTTKGGEQINFTVGVYGKTSSQNTATKYLSEKLETKGVKFSLSPNVITDHLTNTNASQKGFYKFNDFSKGITIICDEADEFKVFMNYFSMQHKFYINGVPFGMTLMTPEGENPYLTTSKYVTVSTKSNETSDFPFEKGKGYPEQVRTIYFKNSAGYTLTVDWKFTFQSK